MTGLSRAETLGIETAAFEMHIGPHMFFIEDGGLRVDNSGPFSAKDVREKILPYLHMAFDLPEADVAKHARALSVRGAAKGGAARAKKLSPEKRRAIARKAARSRWKK